MRDNEKCKISHAPPPQHRLTIVTFLKFKISSNNSLKGLFTIYCTRYLCLKSSSYQKQNVTCGNECVDVYSMAYNMNIFCKSIVY